MTRTHATILLTAWTLALATASAARAQTATRPAASAPASQTQPALTPDEWMAKGDEAVAANDSAAAIAAYSKAVEAEPSNITALVALADASLKANNLMRAKEIYQAAEKISPNDWRPQFGLGTMYLQRSYFPLAKRYLEHADVLAPYQSRAKVLVNLALTYRGLYQTAEAMDRARRALAIDSSNMDARNLLISLYLDDKRLDDAIAESLAGLDLFRRNGTAHPEDRKTVEQLLQALTQHVDLLQRKLAAQPDDATTRLQLVEILEETGQTNRRLICYRALDTLQPAMQKSPENVDLLLAHARLLQETAQFPQAAAELKKILTISPDNPQAKKLLEAIESPTPQASH